MDHVQLPDDHLEVIEEPPRRGPYEIAEERSVEPVDARTDE